MAARIWSKRTFSERWRCCNSETGKPVFPRPSTPLMSVLWTGSPSSDREATPSRGQRGGSSCSITACTLRVAWSGGTLPPVAVTATTSHCGSNRASVMATASSMPGSTSKMTFLVIILASQVSSTQASESRRARSNTAQARGSQPNLRRRGGPGRLGAWIVRGVRQRDKGVRRAARCSILNKSAAEMDRKDREKQRKSHGICRPNVVTA